MRVLLSGWYRKLRARPARREMWRSIVEHLIEGHNLPDAQLSAVLVCARAVHTTDQRSMSERVNDIQATRKPRDRFVSLCCIEFPLA